MKFSVSRPCRTYIITLDMLFCFPLFFMKTQNCLFANKSFISNLFLQLLSSYFWASHIKHLGLKFLMAGTGALS